VLAVSAGYLVRLPMEIALEHGSSVPSTKDFRREEATADPGRNSVVFPAGPDFGLDRGGSLGIPPPASRLHGSSGSGRRAANSGWTGRDRQLKPGRWDGGHSDLEVGFVGDIHTR
jgi:hypothetical protein